MDPERQAAADRKLEEAIAASGARDPRPPFREALREIGPQGSVLPGLLEPKFAP